MTVALDAGALDIKNDPKEDSYEVITAPEDLAAVKAAVEAAGIQVSLAETTMLPKSYVTLDEKGAEQMVRLTDALEDNEDVQNVYANFDIPDEVMNAR
jgi:transcriptional/translational regulatory protein YebC/TACO1